VGAPTGAEHARRSDHSSGLVVEVKEEDDKGKALKKSTTAASNGVSAASKVFSEGLSHSINTA
jgi:hypothetical protein